MHSKRAHIGRLSKNTGGGYQSPRQSTGRRVANPVNELTSIFESLSSPKRETLLLLNRMAATMPATQLDKLVNLAEEFQQTASAYTPPPLPAVGSGYKILLPRTFRSRDELRAFVIENWGPWLKSVHPSLPCDAISRQELKQRDPRLMHRMEHDFQPDELAAIIQTKSQRLDDVIGKVDVDEARKLHRQARATLLRATRGRGMNSGSLRP